MKLDIKTARVFKPLLKPSRYKGAYGGRGSAKSHFFAEKLIEEHVARKIDSVCVREIQKTLSQSVKKLLEIKIEKLGVGHLFIVQDSVIKVKNGGLIVFQGMQNSTADSIKSLEGFDIAWVEEAQTLSQRSLDLLRPTIRKEGSEIWFSWNPEIATDPVDVFLRCDDPPPDAIVIQSNYKDNPWFPEVLRKEMEYDRSRDLDKYNHVWLGQYKVNTKARVFHNFEIKGFKRPIGTIYRFGADWGFANDPTVLIRFSIEGNTIFVDYEACMIGCEIVNTPDLFLTVPESERYWITADNARPETISYMKSHGFPKIKAAIKGPGSIKDGIEFLKSYNVIIHPRCENAVNEFLNYSFKVDPLTDEILPIFEDKNNHVIDAMRYACEGVRKLKKRKFEQTEYIVADTTIGY